MPSVVDAAHGHGIENSATRFLSRGLRARQCNEFFLHSAHYSKLPVFANLSPRAPVLAKIMSTRKKTGSRIQPFNEPMPGNILLSAILALCICAKSETFAVKKVCGFLPGVFHKKMFKEF